MNFRITIGKTTATFIISIAVSFLITKFSYPPNIHGFNQRFFISLISTFIFLFLILYIMASLILKKENLQKQTDSKSRKYWLGGGISGASIILIYYIILSPFLFLQLSESFNDLKILIDFVKYLVIFFLVGAIIGFIIGKIKSRKQIQQP